MNNCVNRHLRCRRFALVQSSHSVYNEAKKKHSSSLSDFVYTITYPPFRTIYRDSTLSMFHLSPYITQMTCNFFLQFKHMPTSVCIYFECMCACVLLVNVCCHYKKGNHDAIVHRSLFSVPFFSLFSCYYEHLVWLAVVNQ